jgi:hypothetical protein
MAETRISAGRTSGNEWIAEETKLIAQAFTKTIIYKLKRLSIRGRSSAVCRENNKLGNVGRHNTSCTFPIRNSIDFYIRKRCRKKH